MLKYRIYVEQENQTMYEVDATSKTDARDIVRKQAIRDYDPLIDTVELVE